jgi:ribosome-binding protein aMBF1 (putative translation factor)
LELQKQGFQEKENGSWKLYFETKVPTSIFVKFQKRIFVEKEENLVKKTCRELGITQKELAEKTGFSEDSISKWNKGAKIPKSAENFFHTLIRMDKFQQMENLVNQIKTLTL